jgi:hypothetical protein
VPDAVRTRLEREFRRNLLRNAFLTRELLGILRLFAERGIAAIPFKGPLLASSVYGSIALRQFSDLDIMVPKRDLAAVKELLLSHDYRSYYQRSAAQEALHLRFMHDYTFAREDRKALLEIHWEILERSYSVALDPEQLWERKQFVSLGSERILSFSPEDLLLILCVHGAKHFWERLAWLCDLARLINVHQAMNWGQVVARARMVGSERILFLGLFLASELLNASLPEEISAAIYNDRQVKLLATEVRRELFPGSQSASSTSRRYLFHLRTRERVRDRLLYCFHRALVPTVRDLESFPLPAVLSPLYYPLRPIRLIATYGLGFFRSQR